MRYTGMPAKANSKIRKKSGNWALARKRDCSCLDYILCGVQVRSIPASHTPIGCDFEHLFPFINSRQPKKATLQGTSR